MAKKVVKTEEDDLKKDPVDVKDPKEVNPDDSKIDVTDPNGDDDDDDDEKDKETQEKVEVAEVKVTSTKLRTVEIYATEEIDANIGGVEYRVKKGASAKVPSDVAAILSNSKKAYRK